MSDDDKTASDDSIKQPEKMRRQTRDELLDRLRQIKREQQALADETQKLIDQIAFTWRSHWLTPVDVVILCLVLCVCFVLIVIAIMTSFPDHQLSENKSELFVDLVHALIAIVTIYVGAKLNTVAGR